MGIEESCPRPLRPRPPPQQPIRRSRPGGVSRPKPRPGPGGGVSGAVTSLRDPAGDVRGAARVVGARLARARVGGARPGPRTLQPQDRGDGGRRQLLAPLLAPPLRARWPCRPAGGAQPQVPRGWRARARAGARRPLSRDSEVGGQGGEGLGGACARTRGAGLETHSHWRGHTLGRAHACDFRGPRNCPLLRVPSSALRRLRTLVFAAVLGARGFVVSWNWSDVGSSGCPLEGRAHGRGHRGAPFPRRGAFRRNLPGGVS